MNNDLDVEYQNDSARFFPLHWLSFTFTLRLFELYTHGPIWCVLLLMKIYRFNYFHYVFAARFVPIGKTFSEYYWHISLKRTGIGTQIPMIHHYERDKCWFTLLNVFVLKINRLSQRETVSLKSVNLTRKLISSNLCYPLMWIDRQQLLTLVSWWPSVRRPPSIWLHLEH